MQEHETVVRGVMVGNDMGYFHPVARLHVAGVDGRVEGERVNVVVEAVQLGHIVTKLLEIEVLERASFRVLYHSDSSARINNKDVWGAKFVHRRKSTKKRAIC